MTSPQLNWLGDPARFERVIADMDQRSVGSLQGAEEALAAEWMGHRYTPQGLREAAELVVRCTDCAAVPVLTVTYIGDQPLVAALQRGDRLDPAKPGKRSWQFSWLNRGSMAYVRCDRQFIVALPELRKIVPPSGAPRHTEKISHRGDGPIFR